MYGLDAVIPVERTDIGNISLSSVQFEPELFRCMTLKGAEIILRTATGGCEWHDMRLTAYHNDVFVTIVNNSIDTFRPSDNYFVQQPPRNARSEEHTSELPSLMRSSYAVFCFKKKTL